MASSARLRAKVVVLSGLGCPLSGDQMSAAGWYPSCSTNHSKLGLAMVRIGSSCARVPTSLNCWTGAPSNRLVASGTAVSP